MSKGIEISPKHGLNPTISVCFFCGEDKNEIALMGRVRERDPRTGRAVKGSDVEIPMRMVLDYEPCDCCKEKFSTGVLLMGVTTRTTDGRPAIQRQPDGTYLYPSGSYAVITPEAASKCFDMDLEAGGKLFLDQSVLEQLLSNSGT